MRVLAAFLWVVGLVSLAWTMVPFLLVAPFLSQTALHLRLSYALDQSAPGATLLLLLPGIVSLDRPLMWLGLGLWIGLFSGTYIVAMTIVGERFRGADLVTANASFGFLWGLGILTGPFLSGTAMDIWDPDGFPGVLAAVTAMVLAVALYRRWQVRGR